ncbi:MAG TPA: tetratricopeptide repeat protein, partial [Candidatus Hydrogenedentes bacterium]|nr:tetratricopeptide repeat protein [Candidatus Hydrogenedentota bacterium]
REQVEEDPLDRATRETTAANVGLENLAAAVPSTEASDQPLEQDLIDSLVAQAAQAAAQPAPPTRDIPAAGGGAEPQRDSHLAMGLSDDDFDDIGMPGAAPATLVSEPADEPKSTEELGESPVVERRLTRRPALPRKLVASIAASLLVGGGALLFFWPKAKEVEVPAATETHDASLELEDVIIIAKELMGKGEYVAAMKQLGTAIRKSEPGPLLNEARFLHVEAGYRSLPPNPRDVDTETVLKNIEDVIGLNEKYSRNPEALMWKADLYKRTGSPTTARATYERILSSYASAPNIDQVLLEHARLSFDLKYFDDAITNFKRVVEELPQSPHKSEAQMLLAKSYEQTGRIPEAEAQYAAVAAERTDSRVGAEAALALARLAKAANDLPRAIQALEARLQTATTVDGNDGVYVELAKAYRATGKPIDAVRIARELISFFPESPHVPEAAVELTRALEATGDRGQALELAQQAAERFDKNPDVLRNRAQLLAKSGDTRGAADALVKADELGADDPAVLLEAAQKYVELNGVGDASKAETLLKSILERFPKSTQAVDASVSLARLEYERGELAAAIDRLSALASGDHDQTQDLAIQSALGGIYSELGLKKRATAAYEKVAALTSDPELLAQAATALLKNGAIGSALPVIRKFDAAQLSSKTGFDLLMAQGRALLDIDPEQALGKMQQAFESYPVERTPEDYEYLVRACVETGKTAHARVLVSDFNTYVQSHPEESPRLQRTATLWGDALYKSGDYRAALDAYALVAPPEISPVPMPGEEPAEAEAEPAPLPADVLWAKYQRANAMLKLDDYWNSVPILESLAETESPYAEDARLKAEYARLEQRLRNETPPSAGGGPLGTHDR